MLSEFELIIIQRAREHPKLQLTFPQIAILLDKTPDQCRMALNGKKVADYLGEKLIIRKSIITPEMGRQIIAILSGIPQKSSRDLEVDLRSFCPPETPTPKRTCIQTWLKRTEFVNRKAKRRQFISSVNMKKRLEYAREYLQKDDWFWDTIIWSDETMVKKATNNQDLNFRVRGDRIDLDSVSILQIQQGGIGMMFWGCFSRFGLVVYCKDRWR